MPRIIAIALATLLVIPAAFAGKTPPPSPRGRRAQAAMQGVADAVVTRVERSPRGSGFRFFFRKSASKTEGYRDADHQTVRADGQVFGSYDTVMITRDARGRTQDPPRQMRVGEP